MGSSESTGLIDKERTEQLIHARVNGIRTTRDKSTLEYDTELRAIARAHSRDMAKRNFFSHVNPDGETVADRYEKHGYKCNVEVKSVSFVTSYATGGENIAKTAVGVHVRTANGVRFLKDEDDVGTNVMRGWMESDGHRENLLEDHWEREGIGIYIDDRSAASQIFVTQNLC